MKKSSLNISENILDYFETTKLVGSILLVNEGLVSTEDINNINIGYTDSKPWESDSCTFRIIRFLKDKGFKETSIYETHLADSYNQGSLEFVNPEYDLPISLIRHGDKFNVYDIPQVISDKFKRATESDLNQIEKAVEVKKSQIKDGEAN